MGTWITTLGQQVAGNASSTALNMATDWVDEKINGKWRREAQLKQQEALQNQQIEGQKQLGIFNLGMQKSMYDYTYNKNTPEAMKENYLKAGMNPALAYGGGATNVGGTTVGSASAGNVAGGNASDEVSRKRAGIEAGQASQGMALQMELIKAQKENIQADTANKLADAENKKQGTVESGSRTSINRIQELLQQKELGNWDAKRQKELDLLTASTESQASSAFKNDAEVTKIHAEASNINKDTELKTQEIKNMQAEVKKIASEMQVNEAEINKIQAEIPLIHAEFNTEIYRALLVRAQGDRERANAYIDTVEKKVQEWIYKNIGVKNIVAGRVAQGVVGTLVNGAIGVGAAKMATKPTVVPKGATVIP